MMVCPDILELEQFLAAEIDGEVHTRISDHLEDCVICRERLSDVADNLSVADDLQRLQLNGQQNNKPPQSVGRFEIIREIGRGGMAVVYLAQQNQPRREVALKLIQPHLLDHWHDGSRMQRRFEHEADILAQLRHPGIAQIYEAGVDTITGVDGESLGEQPYFAMEHVSGRRLDSYIRETRLAINQRLELLAKVCDAVHHAHVNGVIHRDLKPANIIVPAETTSADHEAALLQPKVLDFGVARLIGDNSATKYTLHTHVGQVIGTVPYMSPEQVRGEPGSVDIRSDVYALGVIGFELLSGELPFDIANQSLVETARSIADDPPRRLSTVHRELTGDVETIIAKAINKDPTRRYQSAAELAADIRRYLNKQPIIARPAGTWYQLSRFAARNRPLVVGFVVAFVALVAGLVISLQQMQVAFAARDEAQQRLDDVVEQGSHLMNRVVAELNRTPGTEPVSFAIARQVHEHFGDLAEQYPDHRGVQESFWASKRLLASMLRMRGEYQQSLDLMRDSHALMLEFAKRDPEDVDLRFERGYSLVHVANAEWHFDQEAAEAHRREAVPWLVELARDVPDNAIYQREAGHALLNVAQIEQRERNLPEADELLEQAAHFYRRAAQAEPENPVFATYEASVRQQQASLAEVQSDHDQAVAHLRDALAIYAQLQPALHDDLQYRRNVAACHHHLAAACFRQDDWPLAEDHAQLALQRYESLVASNPQELAQEAGLINVLKLLSRIETARGDSARAEHYNDRIESIRAAEQQQ